VTNVRQFAMICVQIVADRLSRPDDLSPFQVHQARQGAQQAGLARAVRTTHQQALPRLDTEAEVPQHVPVPPPQVQVLSLKAAVGHGSWGYRVDGAGVSQIQ